MRRFLQTLLLWLLIAALPVQAMAAVVNMTCGSVHPAALPAPIVHAHSHDMHAASHHQHLAADVVAADNGRHLASSEVGQAADTKHDHKSSYCSACSIGAVAPPAVIAWPSAVTGSDVVRIVPAVLSTGFIPAGLERPPRSIAA